MKFLSCLLGSLLLTSPAIYAQGLIVNEFSNGSSGSVEEYIELLVIGSTAAPTANVNLSGWIIDDNNGSFDGSSGTGVAAGHFRIAAGCLTSVPVGAIILIYNKDEPHAGIPADDETDSNNDKVYILPHTSSCIQVNATIPNSTGPSTAYTGSGSYVPTTLTGLTSWVAIGLASSGDAAQVRKPDASFYHGFSYGGITSPFPSFPAAMGGGSSANIAIGSGSTFAYALSCGDFTDVANYSKIAYTSATPGAANNAANTILIANIKIGAYDYANPTAANNCVLTVLPVADFSFEAQPMPGYTALSTLLPAPHSYRSLVIERSTDGLQYQTLATVSLDPAATQGQPVTFQDQHPVRHCFYRMALTEGNGNTLYAPVQEVSQSLLPQLRVWMEEETLRVLLPEPLIEPGIIRITDLCGRHVAAISAPAGEAMLAINTAALQPGVYFIHLQEKYIRFVAP